MHLLENHRDTIIATTSNKHQIDNCIKSNSSYIRIILKTDTGSADYYVSFGYNSGWSEPPKMKKTIEKTIEHRQAHLDVCKELLAEINATKPATSIETDTTKYNDLLAKYKKLEKVNERNEATLERLRQNARVNSDTLNVLQRVYSIDDETLYFDVVERIKQLYELYPPSENDDENEKNEATREAELGRISF
jgi:hypothetical protein